MNENLEAASAEFKSQPSTRARHARVLIGEIRKGQSPGEVEARLGPPSSILWDYPLFYSSTLTVTFGGSPGVVRNVDSDLSAEGIGDGNDSSTPEVRAAIKEFQSSPSVRQGAARRLIPFLKPGLSTHEVKMLLGDQARTIWEYAGGPGQPPVVIITFDSKQVVADAQSTSAVDR